MHIFLVEDEKSLSQLITVYLTEAGYQVTPFYDGLAAKASIGLKPDLWILDIMLPGLDGYGLIKEIKAVTPNIPVIFTSARNAELDRVIGLEMGSDDYLPKPFLPRELVIRVNRILDRGSQVTPKTKANPTIGRAIFDRDARAIMIDQQAISLTNKEYDLLDYFVEEIDKAISRNDLIDRVWGMDYFGSDRVVDDTIRRLRKKIPDLPIEPVYGYGYLLKSEVSE